MPTTPETDPIAFSERLKEAWLDSGQLMRGAGAALSRQFKVSGPTAHGWLNGKHMPEALRVRALAKQLEVNFDWLMFGRGVKRDTAGALVLGEPQRSRAVEDGFEIPQLAVSGAMGAGTFVPDHVDVVRNISVSLTQLRRQVHFTSPENLSFITGYGPSMEPTFYDGDVLLVDRGVNEVLIDAVFVLTLNGKLYIKTLQRRPDGFVLMISDNKKYEPYVITEADSVVIQGRVLMAWNARRL